MTPDELREIDVRIQRDVFGATDLRRLCVYNCPDSGDRQVGPEAYLSPETLDRRGAPPFGAALDWCYLPPDLAFEPGEERSDLYCSVVPAYTEDISEAWKVVDETGRRSAAMQAVVRTSGGTWGCRFGNVVAVGAATAPLAICLAALKAVSPPPPDSPDGGKDADSYKHNPGGSRA